MSTTNPTAPSSKTRTDETIHTAFSRFLPAEKPVEAKKAPEVKTAGMKFENPEVCQYCGKMMQRSRVNEEDVLVCWDDRNVTPVFTGDLV